MGATLETDSDTTFSDRERQELASSLAGTSSALLHASDDLFTRSLDRYVREKFGAWKPNGPSAAALPKAQGPLEKIDVIPAIVQSPAYDEDGEEDLLPKQLLSGKLKALPVLDEATPWPCVEEARRILAAEFGPLLPPPPVTWSEPASDRTLSLVAFQGLGAHRLEPVADDPEGATWAVDLAWMCAFPVRDGLEPYGACAYFAADRSLQRIYTSHDDRTHRPGDSGWEHAKWRWRCTLFTAVTVADHLGWGHAPNPVAITSTPSHERRELSF